MKREQPSGFRSDLSYRAMAIHLPVLLALSALWVFASQKIAFLREYGYLLPVIAVIVIDGVALLVRARFRESLTDIPEG